MLKSLSTTDFGLIGHPLGHSFSKAFFTDLFAKDSSGRSYDNFDIPELTPNALYSLVLMNPNLKGFNVTAPYKEAIIEYLDRIDDSAKAVGAVNTVRVVRDTTGRVTALEGFNTDVIGFHNSVLPFVENLSEHSGALVLGTGGASLAVAHVLSNMGLKVTRVSRNPKEDGVIAYNSLNADIIAANHLIVNATPLGTWPNVDACPDFPYDMLTSAHFAHDLVYNPVETEFMRRCAAHGATTKNGLEMLHGQALAALKIWEQK